MTHYELRTINIELKPLCANSSIEMFATYDAAIKDIERQCTMFSLMDRKHPDFFKRVKAQMKRYGIKNCALPRIYVHCENGTLMRILFELRQTKSVISFKDEFKEEEQMEMELDYEETK